jgi:beta-glucosidase
MRFRALLCTLIAVCIHVSTFAQSTISGRVIDNNSNPVSGAAVALKIKNQSVTTGTDGTFSLITSTAILSRYNNNNLQRALFLNGRNLLFTLKQRQTIRIEIFDMSGRRTGVPFSKIFPAGAWSLSLTSLMTRTNASSLHIVRVTTGNHSYTVPYNPVSGITATINESNRDQVLAKQLETTDTLIITKEGFTTLLKTVDSDLTQELGDLALQPTVDIEAKVESLLALMTVEEKIAQTTEALVNIISPDVEKEKNYGSVFNGGGCPFGSNTKETWSTELDKMHDAAAQSRLHIPILYGIDAVHGLGTVEGATVFPHNIGMGCAGDTALVARMANITAKECRALGINLNFGPAISVVRNERWGRSYEGYGETPEINSMMARAYIRGLQGYGDLTRPDAMAACAKHFIGDGGTTNGTNGGVTELSDATMRAIHLPPYKAAVEQGVASIMPSYNAWKRDGQEIRCTNDKYSLTEMLKTGLNWKGFCLSDWDAIPRAMPTTDAAHYYADNNVAAAINAGIDMAMIACDWTAYDEGYINDYNAAFKRLVEAGTIPMSRLDDAARRILRVKFRLNLFENAKSDASLRAEFGSAAHREVARECVQKSLVLLKNEGNALPLQKSENIVVVGPWANKIGAQCGGWTISWQGAVDNESIVGTTILEGLQSVGSNVTFDESGNNLANADKIVLIVGEAPYSETQGDHGLDEASGESCPNCYMYAEGKMSIFLKDCPNANLIEQCSASGKPVIIVLISGRPMIITDELAKCGAFVAAWLPGSEGGGVADVLFGDAPFSGKLTHTWPRSFDQIPINTGTAYSDEPKGSGGDPLFEYGYGLTY